MVAVRALFFDVGGVVALRLGVMVRLLRLEPWWECTSPPTAAQRHKRITESSPTVRRSSPDVQQPLAEEAVRLRRGASAP